MYLNVSLSPYKIWYRVDTIHFLPGSQDQYLLHSTRNVQTMTHVGGRLTM